MDLNSNIQLTFKAIRPHTFFSKTYYLKLFDNFFTLGEVTKLYFQYLKNKKLTCQNPKYEVNLELAGSVYWKTVMDKKGRKHFQSFGINYNNQVKYFNASETDLEKFRSLIANKIIFKNLQEIYDVKSLIGKGSTCEVYLSIDQTSQQKFAIKLINQTNVNNSKSLDFLLNEILIWRSINHQNAVKLKEVFAYQNTFCLVSEYIEGQTLAQILQDNTMLSNQKIRTIMNQLIQFNECLLEQKILHRDMKPDNIMLIDNEVVKVIDFGMSGTLNNPKTLLQTCGTPGYFAPEILNSSRSIHSDVFSIGVIYYNLLTGKQLFNGQNIKETLKLNKKCQLPNMDDIQDVTARELLQNMLSKQPENRISYSSALKLQYFSLEKISAKESPMQSFEKDIKTIY